MAKPRHGGRLTVPARGKSVNFGNKIRGYPADTPQKRRFYGT
ncbi:hypothetical protein CUS_7278 [Ruminococcus albus 8]|uniref:Uncharacterized protein n=1 Tax=Ruminococcus albus 8 TaxID=246199 RepID=E9S7Q3_RUMAL|nr:hypothetical protein CUS_7278 [Ruminococcus albus 8]